MLENYTVNLDVSSLPSAPIGEPGKFPQSYGIYFLLDRRGQILYIGQSRSIRNRWAGHHKLKTARTFAGARLAWLLVPRMVDLISLERSLVDKFLPPMNDARHWRTGTSRQPLLI